MRSPFNTLPEMLQYVSDCQYLEQVLYYKSAGEWQSLTFKDFLSQIKYIAAGLQKLGLSPGDRVGIMARSSPLWLIADLAVTMAGGVTVPFFIPFTPEHFIYKKKDAALAFLIVLDAETWPHISNHIDGYKNVITGSFPESLLAEETISWDDLMELGRQSEGMQKITVTPGDLFTIIYTSGSEGIPKGVRLTQENIVSQIQAAMSCFPLQSGQEVALSCLPLAHSFERMVIYTYLASGISIYFADDIRHTGTLLAEVHPTVMTVVPRLLEKVYGRMKIGVQERNGFSGWIAQNAFKWAKNNRSQRKGLKALLFEKLVFRQMRKGLGGRLCYVICGGAPLSTDLYWYFKNIGLAVYQGYGLTEASPVICTNRNGEEKIGTVGKPFPNVQVKLSADGELLAKGPGIMQGYHNQPGKTAEVIDREGFLHTGDLATIHADGFVSITGRIKEMYKTSGGKYISPVPIEQELCEDRLINLAMVVGEGRNYVTCLLFPDFEELHALKIQYSPETTEDAFFLNSPEISARMDNLLRRVNSKRNHWEKVQKYCFVLAVPSIESGELTPTMKLRRHVIREKYKDKIDTMYAKAE